MISALFHSIAHRNFRVARNFGFLVFIVSCFAFAPNCSYSGSYHKKKNLNPPIQGITYTVVVYDSANHLPIDLARVGLYRGSTFVKGKVTNPEGRAVFTDVVAGSYRMVARAVGYNEFTDSVLS